jgi:hypothetical protein
LDVVPSVVEFEWHEAGVILGGMLRMQWIPGF